MKRYINTFTLIVFSLLIALSSCNKSDDKKLSDDDFKVTEADLLFAEGEGFEKVITKEIVKTDDCKYIVSGTIEFRKNGEAIAVVDFGDGECDNIATKTVDGQTTEFKLERKNKYLKYTKVVAEPIIKIEGCEYIVSGIVEFYKGDLLVATIDFGDGSCDDIATKYWDGGSKEFSLSKD